MADYRQRDFASLIAFSRSEAGSYRDATGAIVAAAIDAPRFDHDDAGQARGFLVTAGADLGGADRAALQAGFDLGSLDDFATPGASDCTVLHRYALPADDANWADVRRAWYSRNARATVKALLGQAGHHLQIAVVPGFRPNISGIVHHRRYQWLVAGALDAGIGAITDGLGRPLILGGA